MINFLRKNLFILKIHLLIILVLLMLLMLFSKEEIHIFINQHMFEAGNTFFRYYTQAGHGYFAAFVVIVCAIVWKYRIGIQMALSLIVSGMIVQFLKKFVFYDYMRPVKYFNRHPVDNFHLNLIEGLNMHTSFSFPSGHTTTAFAMLLTIILNIGNKWLQLVLLIMAYLIGFSRIYLSQHFLMDVTAGAIIGSLISILFYLLINQSKKSWLDKKLITFK